MEEIANVKQIQQMIPIWFLVSIDVFDLDFGVQINSIAQPIKSNFVMETCLIVGLLPLMVILMTASFSSNTYNKAS